MNQRDRDGAVEVKMKALNFKIYLLCEWTLKNVKQEKSDIC